MRLPRWRCWHQAPLQSSFRDEPGSGAAGGNGTRFTNPTGLHEDGMVTTARDIAAIARAAWGNDLFMRTVSATSIYHPCHQRVRRGADGVQSKPAAFGFQPELPERLLSRHERRNDR